MRKYRYYETLEVSRTATQEEINVAFRRLARMWHPDRNPGQSEAEAVFRRINTAYQVLGHEGARAEYDRSPVECPTCGTHEVLSMNDGRWQCRHCGCRFDASGAAEIQAMDAPGAPPLRRARFRAFQAIQCSWCARFYDREPPTCPHRAPQTNCDAFRPVTESERSSHLRNAAMPGVTDEWLRPTADRRLIKKCTYCGALNPNPSRLNEPCWNCHRALRDECPHCGLAMMFYDVEHGAWRCANNQCAGKQFAYDSGMGTWRATVHQQSVRTPPRRNKRRSSQPPCPNCGAGLVYSNLQSMWCCVVCRNFYTPDQAGRSAPEDAPIPVRPPRTKREKAARPVPPRKEHRSDYSAFMPSSRPTRRRSAGDFILLASAITLIVVIGTLVALGMTGYLG